MTLAGHEKEFITMLCNSLKDHNPFVSMDSKDFVVKQSANPPDNELDMILDHDEINIYTGIGKLMAYMIRDLTYPILLGNLLPSLFYKYALLSGKNDLQLSLIINEYGENYEKDILNCIKAPHSNIVDLAETNSTLQTTIAFMLTEENEEIYENADTEWASMFSDSTTWNNAKTTLQERLRKNMYKYMLPYNLITTTFLLETMAHTSAENILPGSIGFTFSSGTVSQIDVKDYKDNRNLIFMVFLNAPLFSFQLFDNKFFDGEPFNPPEGVKLFIEACLYHYIKYNFTVPTVSKYIQISKR